MLCTASSLIAGRKSPILLISDKHSLTVFRTSNGRPASTPASTIAFAKYETYSSNQEVKLDNIAIHSNVAANATSTLG
jgi:hypothetical protein